VDNELPAQVSLADASAGWDMELESKPDFGEAMQRIYAWYEQAMIDRVPVRFTRHNAEYEGSEDVWKPQWRDLKDKWFDEEYQVDRYLRELKGKRFHGETFPVFFPNLGPAVSAAFYGCPLEFGEVTSWAQPVLSDYSQRLTLDWNGPYMKKLEDLTRCALEVCRGKFIVGYTDLHGGLDVLAALRGTEPLLLDLVDRPDAPLALLDQICAESLAVYDYFHEMLRAKGQPSATWMAIPSFGKMHIPSCDFAYMISTRQFMKYQWEINAREMRPMTHNIYHVDGKGVAHHLDEILQLPNLHAIQWVQGVGDDMPIMQWVPLIKRIQAVGKSVMVDLAHSELEDFMAAVRPEGILLTMASQDEEEEFAILKRIARW
jgi:hypothetical protein